MLNNYWEEQDMNKRLKMFHESRMNEMKLPDWIHNIACPFCNRKLPKRSVRNVQLCLNTRNFGEIAVEIFCDDCSKMDTLYHRTKIHKQNQFLDLLRHNPAEQPDMIIEEEMFKMNYNNIMELMFQEQKPKEEEE